MALCPSLQRKADSIKLAAQVDDILNHLKTTYATKTTINLWVYFQYSLIKRTNKHLPF